MQCQLCQEQFEGTDPFCPKCFQQLTSSSQRLSQALERSAELPETTAAAPRPPRQRRGRMQWQIESDGSERGLLYPISVAARHGRILVLDQPEDFRLWEATADGRLGRRVATIPFGNRPGQLDDPQGLCIDPAGRVLIPDAGNDRISVWSRDGEFQGVMGSRGNGPGQLARPADVDVDDEGFVYVADTWNRRIQVFSPEGIVCLSVGELAGLGRFEEPVAITSDDEKNIFVADGKRNLVAKLSASGALLSAFPSARQANVALEHPGDVRIANDGAWVVADCRNTRVCRWSSSGELLGVVDLASDGDAIHEGGDIALWEQFVLIPDRLNDRLYCMEFSPA